MTLRFVTPDAAVLAPGPARDRANVERRYLMSLSSKNLLRPYLFESGLWSYTGSVGTTVGEPAEDSPDQWHWGWESPTSELRGHILGHWLSAAAYHATFDGEVRAKADAIVAELARCHAANRDGWIAGFPRDYLNRITQHVPVWAPQYTIHKVLMGLLDMHAVAGNDQALEVLLGAADYFYRWTTNRTREELDDILDVETGGMLEIWAALYERTGMAQHKALIERYDRPRFFDRLLAGDDVLTNRHANTQIPEIIGAARAWEATGEQRWRDIVETFWDAAVTRRGTYCTGGSTDGEVWQPPHSISTRLQRVQEHCTVYNLMRLAEIQYRWTGDRRFADYWERNLLNGIWSQQHRQTGMVTYFLPLGADSTKTWGTPTSDFWCCHGTLLQAHSHVQTSVVQHDEDGLRISQFIPSTTQLEVDGAGVAKVTIEQDPIRGVVFGQTVSAAGLRAIQSLEDPVPVRRPNVMVFSITVDAENATPFAVRVRLPGWLTSAAIINVDGETIAIDANAEWLELNRVWKDSVIQVEFAVGVRCEQAPGDEGLVSFADGPYVLAALGPTPSIRTDEQALEPDEERTHGWWNAGAWRVADSPQVQFRPLNEVIDDSYTVYFPTRTAP